MSGSDDFWEEVRRLGLRWVAEPEVASQLAAAEGRGRHKRRRLSRRERVQNSARKIFTWRRDYGMCQIKSPVCIGKESDGLYRQLTLAEATVDHIIPRSRGGTSRPLNLQCACRPCNQWKADRIEPVAEGNEDDGSQD